MMKYVLSMRTFKDYAFGVLYIKSSPDLGPRKKFLPIFFNLTVLYFSILQLFFMLY